MCVSELVQGTVKNCHNSEKCADNDSAAGESSDSAHEQQRDDPLSEDSDEY